jgi:hypothetical protein
VDGVIYAAQAKKTMDLCWKIETLTTRAICAATRRLRPARIIEQKEESHAPNADRCGMPDGHHEYGDFAGQWQGAQVSPVNLGTAQRPAARRERVRPFAAQLRPRRWSRTSSASVDRQRRVEIDRGRYQTFDFYNKPGGDHSQDLICAAFPEFQG